MVELDVGSALVLADVLEVMPEPDDAAGVLELVAGVDEPELEPELELLEPDPELDPLEPDPELDPLELDPLEDPDEEPDDVEPEPDFDDASGSVYC